MKLFENEDYIKDLDRICNIEFPWDELRNSTVLVTGATGLLGSFLIDMILRKDLNCKIYAMCRNIERMRNRFSYCSDRNLVPIKHNVNIPLNMDVTQVDYIFHLASNTHPIQYSTDPIGTIKTNVFGLANLLDYAEQKNIKKFIFASSNEVYGENRGDVEFFSEDYCGYINSNTLRAGYPESKRCGEAICHAYIRQKGLNVLIPRFTRSYGPTMLMSDSKAINQFLKNALAGEDIVLKSTGQQYYSYTYVADAISGLMYVLFFGENGNAYNISNEKGDIRLCDLAEYLAKISGRKVIYNLPSADETAGFSTATKARLDGSKLSKLGWNAHYDIFSGLEQTIKILKTI